MLYMQFVKYSTKLELLFFILVYTSVNTTDVIILFRCVNRICKKFAIALVMVILTEK